MNDLGNICYQINEQIMSRVNGEIVVAYDKDTGSLFELDTVGAVIFEKIKSNISVNEIVTELAQEFGENEDTIKEDVYSFLLQMEELSIITQE